MNKSIKSKHFANWLNRKIGGKDKFSTRFDWEKREINRWTQGKNFPKVPILAALLFDIHLYTGEEIELILIQCLEVLMKDYKEYKYGSQ